MIEGGFLSLRPKLLPCPRLQLHYEKFLQKAFKASRHHSDVIAIYTALLIYSSFPLLPAECILVSSVTAFGTNPEKGK
jgi:hypothetical protein